jgi:hypothetical protein
MCNNHSQLPLWSDGFRYHGQSVDERSYQNNDSGANFLLAFQHVLFGVTINYSIKLVVFIVLWSNMSLKKFFSPFSANTDTFGYIGNVNHRPRVTPASLLNHLNWLKMTNYHYCVLIIEMSKHQRSGHVLLLTAHFSNMLARYWSW